MKKVTPIGTTIVASTLDQEKLPPCNLSSCSITNPQASVASKDTNVPTQ